MAEEGMLQLPTYNYVTTAGGEDKTGKTPPTTAAHKYDDTLQQCTEAVGCV